MLVGRVCPGCGAAPTGDERDCARCGARLLEVRDPLIGQVINERFEVLDLLGRGGMGAVYRALQRSVGREVAIKVMSSGDPTAVRRFLREARLASKLSHPGVVT